MQVLLGYSLRGLKFINFLLCQRLSCGLWPLAARWAQKSPEPYIHSPFLLVTNRGEICALYSDESMPQPSWQPSPCEACGFANNTRSPKRSNPEFIQTSHGHKNMCSWASPYTMKSLMQYCLCCNIKMSYLRYYDILAWHVVLLRFFYENGLFQCNKCHYVYIMKIHKYGRTLLSKKFSSRLPWDKQHSHFLNRL
jgi:hypothetical protein